MMTDMKCFTTILLLLLSGLLPIQAKDIMLLLAPEEGAPVVARIHANDPTIQDASNVLSHQPGNTLWRWMDYPVTLTGYVSTNAVGKNFAIADGTLIRNKQSSTSRILSIKETGDEFLVFESNDKWTKIQVTKEIPVYFNQLNHLSPTKLGEIKEVTKMTPDSLGSRESTGIVVPIDKQTRRSVPKSPGEEFSSPTRTMVGKLVRRIKNYGPRYPLRLLSPSGERIAYIDMSRIFINNLHPYLNQQVYISGEVRPLVPGSRELILFARTIRLSN